MRMVICLTLAFLMVGCGSISDMVKPEVCVVDENGNYPGDPKESAVKQVADFIKQAADMAGQEISDEDAESAAREVLTQFCSGAIDNVELPFAAFKAMGKRLGEEKAFKIAVKMK